MKIVKKSGICRKTNQETIIEVKYLLKGTLEGNEYNKERIDYCPNGGCNKCPIYDEMEDKVYD